LNQENSLLENRIYESLLDVEYFNIELSPCETTLVINASKQGIQAFLNEYGALAVPPRRLSLAKWNRPQRRWLSWGIRFDEEALPDDPVPYVGKINTYTYNTLYPSLDIRYLEHTSLNTVVAGGCQKEGSPFLILNQEGWKYFLKMLNCLLHQKYWFYVTAHPNLKASHRPIPFQLIIPSLDNPFEHPILALEFIRLEPERQIYLDLLFKIEKKPQHPGSDKYIYERMRGLDIRGNSAGFLLFSNWMRAFAVSPDDSQDIENPWNDKSKIMKHPEGSKGDIRLPQPLCLRKACMEICSPIYSFNWKEDDKGELYIFGNSQGFKEIADITEQYAFCSDHDTSFDRPLNISKRMVGEPTSGIPTPSNIHSLDTWELWGGALYNPTYNPFSWHTLKYDDKDMTPQEAGKTFIKDRIYYGDVY
jgi:hypothetical protein